MPDYTPDQRVIPVVFTVVAGTARATPSSQSVDLTATRLDRVEVLIPSGHSGLTGVQLQYDGVTVLPWGVPDTWLIGDGETIDFASGLSMGHAATLRGFNADVYDHSWYVRLVVTDWGLLEAERRGAPRLVSLRSL